MSATPEPGTDPSPAAGQPPAAPAPHRGESVDEAAARLESIAPGYLEKIRRHAAELGVPTTQAGRARRAVAMVAATAPIDPDVPTESRRRAGRLVKRGVGVLTRFYFVHLTAQMSEFGESTSWMGTALCDYIEGLEAEVAALRERVARLEQAPPSP